MRLAAVITARPSYARIQTALEALRAALDLRVICAGAACATRYGAIVEQIRADGYQVTALPGLWEDDHPEAMAQTTAHLLSDLARTFRDLQPDAVLTIADRYETMATALAASYQGIPLIHVQGGERTGSIDDKVRHAITQLADLHLVSSADAARRVMASGLATFRRGAQVVVTGCPSIDLAARAVAQPFDEADFWARNGGVGPRIPLSEPFVMVQYHPDTRDWRQAGVEMDSILAAVDRPALVWWPNVDAGSESIAKSIRLLRDRHPDRPVHVFKQVPASDFYRLLARTEVLIGNSSVGIREAGWLRTKVVNVGRRQQGRQQGPNILNCPPETDSIRSTVEQWRTKPCPPRSTCYGDGSAGVAVARTVMRWLSESSAYAAQCLTSSALALPTVTDSSGRPRAVSGVDWAGAAPI